MAKSRYTVVERATVYTLKEMIELLQSIQENTKNAGNVYVLDKDDEYLMCVEWVEMTCSDGSTVQDVRLLKSID
jgi:hypothetical protein